VAPGPDRLVVAGAQRCGTTFLYRLLDEHPEIEMAKPLRPEPKFFLDDEQYARGLDSYDAQYFSEAGLRVRGEKSTSYLESDVAPQRIMATFPDALVIVLVRDPVQRAISNFRFTRQHGHESLGLDEALRASASGERPWDETLFSVSPHAYLPRGRYVDYLEALARHVPREQTRVLVFEELVRDVGVVAELYGALGVEASFRPASFGEIANASEECDDEVAPELAAWLAEYYREPNRRLEELVGRALPWPAGSAR
jgi:hypothetical protein